MGLGSKRVLPEDLIDSLHEVAAAVSAKRSLDDVLDTVVECAKSITHTDKAVLCLVHEDDHRAIDTSHLAVRGCREMHAEKWWLDALERTGHDVLNGGGRIRVRETETDAVLLVVPIRLAEQPIGLLGAINPAQPGFSPSDEAFLSILGSFAAVAIENTRLAEESRYMLLASERSRIAREMHDGLSQSLFSISLGLELCKRQIWHDPGGVSAQLDDLQAQLKNAMSELRRYIYDLRPNKLADLGLVGAIREWVREICSGRGMVGEVHVTGEADLLGAEIELCLYRIAKEAVSNAVRHAAATRVIVWVRYSSTGVSVEVRDDGRGFAVNDVIALAGIDGGMGLRDMQVWSKRAGGRLSITSSPADGTLVSIHIPAGRMGS